MRPACALRPTSSTDRQQFSVRVDVDAHRMVEVVAARLVLIALDELRSEGIVAHHVALELDGQAAPGQALR